MAVPSDAAAERAGLLDIVARSAHPAPWREGDNIPWHDPGFSARMLREHLTQEHDAASRRMEKIDRHVAWIHEAILSRVRRVHAALREGGVLLLEPHLCEAVRRMGARPPSWYSERSGLFADAPHLCLSEHHWDRDGRAATTRFFVIDAASGGVTRYAQTMQAYEAPEYEALLEDVGFANVRTHASLTGRDEDAEAGLCVLTAVKIGGEGAADADPPPSARGLDPPA
jgi:hypothetical protein